MSADLIMVLALLAAAVVMFILNRPRMDAVGLLMILGLPLTGVIEVKEALAGFADSNVILIALLFVIGEGLVRTGVAQRLGDWLVARAGSSETRLIVLLMLVVAGIGSVMSSTGVVAIFIPIVLRIARHTAISPSRLMMPLSVAALLSGMTTLVGTPPNLVVHGELVREGHRGFSFFSFTPFGLPLLALSVVYMLAARRWLGSPADAGPRITPRLRQSAWIEEYALSERERRFRVKPGSLLIGPTLQELRLRASEGINLLAIERRSRLGKQLFVPAANTRLEADDVLFVDTLWTPENLADLVKRSALEPLPTSGEHFAHLSHTIGMAEVILPSQSQWIGKTVEQARFRAVYDFTVIGRKHGQTPQPPDKLNTPLRPGDTLLVAGPWRAIRRLRQSEPDLVVLNLPAEYDETPPAASRAPFALGALAVVVVLMASGLVPNVVAALIGCFLLGLSGCIDMPAAYRSIHWQTLVLIAGMLPFSLALQRTGGVDLAAGFLLDLVGMAAPQLALAAIFGVTALLGLFISNTATAVLMAPVALAVAGQLKVSPYPFAMTVALAASAAFMTPVSSPVNTLVVGPGKYTFMDFVRVGVPLTLLALLVTVILVPWLLPFQAAQ